jgi:hypothetical protein
MTANVVLYILLPSTLRASLTLSRRERYHENVVLAELITISGVYQLAEPTSDGCTCADVVWGSSGERTVTLHKVLRPLSDAELDSLDMMDDDVRECWVIDAVTEYETGKALDR